jgi:adenylate cyclase
MIGAADIQSARILIVDDQHANVRLLERILGGAGYLSIASTMNPFEVCDLHRRDRYDLILLDLEMPGMDGFQVMAGLKELEKDGYLPVLVITARPEHKLRALQVGARDFVSKPLDLAEVLTRVYNMLEVRLLHLETERLLLNVLPRSVADRLKAAPATIADSFAEVTVLFADIVGFTRLSESLSPERLVGLLNEVFTLFDAIADRRGLEKIKTIGDAYMAAAGLPEPAPDHAERAADMALDLLVALENFNRESGNTLQVRIGLHCGPVMAGVIGTRKFIYDLWGDAVNTASRMESHGVPGRVQVSDALRQRLGDTFTFEDRGLIEVKGKGEMRTWLLLGRAAEDPTG